MASKKSAQNPYRWSNGTWHSRPERAPQTSFTPAKPPAKPKAPTLTPAPGYAPTPVIPLDPQQEATNVANQRNLGISEASAAYDQGRIENEYGLGLDKSNPYSRARLLEETYKRNQLGTLNSRAAAGKLYTGFTGVRQGEDTRNYSIGYDAMSRDYADQLRNVQLGRLQSYGQYGTTGDEAAFQALLKAYRGG